MIQPTETLRAEHADVRRLLAVLQRIGQHVAVGGAFPAADCADALRFLREFVVAVHFHKEGDVVFPAIAMHGDEQDAERVGEALRLQDEALSLVHSLVLFWEPTGELTAAERAGFADTVTMLAGLFDRMIEIEERQLFVAAESIVPPDDRLDWPQAFAAIQVDHRSRADWQPILTRLADAWR